MEFEDSRDAEDAYHEMQDRRVDGCYLTIQVIFPLKQWAKNTPRSNWRYEDDRRRSRSPRRDRHSRDRSPPPRRRSASPAKENDSKEVESRGNDSKMDDAKSSPSKNDRLSRSPTRSPTPARSARSRSNSME